MAELEITEVKRGDKGRVTYRLDNGVNLTLYRSELHRLSLEEQACLREEGAVPEALYRKLLHEIVGLRAKKRAMHLLEQMDRTEQQLYDKLRQGGYPKPCIENAIAYAKSFHYIDDLRYARSFVRSQQHRKSSGRLRMDLMKRGIARDIIGQALMEEYSSDEREKIRALMAERHFDHETRDEREQRRIYQFLLRRGFRSSDIMSELRNAGDTHIIL